ncbi:hypothetical protein GUJ93_ZPchr0001g29403 [Zizania palustris]|uniref:Uncharacterized protein n=1 Tax=Zizania palustris TaxID=103762 RepID=A0A8J5REG6_ZIZPA|nr:hypothetical protein GUJ93_ZPchr0001g29403 [Zizania palustris]
MGQQLLLHLWTYQFNNINGILFTLWTKGRNNRKRVLFGVTVVSTAIWGGGMANQLRYTNDKWDRLIDFKDSSHYAGPFMLYFSYRLLDAMFQSLIYWIICALTNDS